MCEFLDDLVLWDTSDYRKQDGPLYAHIDCRIGKTYLRDYVVEKGSFSSVHMERYWGCQKLLVWRGDRDWGL